LLVDVNVTRVLPSKRISVMPTHLQLTGFRRFFTALRMRSDHDMIAFLSAP
jgi:hypothetical protein